MKPPPLKLPSLLQIDLVTVVLVRLPIDGPFVSRPETRQDAAAEQFVEEEVVATTASQFRAV